MLSVCKHDNSPMWEQMFSINGEPCVGVCSHVKTISGHVQSNLSGAYCENEKYVLNRVSNGTNHLCCQECEVSDQV